MEEERRHVRSTPDEGCTQDAIRCDQRRPEATRGDQRYSEVLRGTQRYSEVLRGTQRSSEEIAPRLGDRRPLDIESAQILTRECVGSVVASCTAFARSGHAQYREA